MQHLPVFVSGWEWHPIVAFLWGRYANGHAKYCLGGYRKFFPLKVTMALRAARAGKAVTSDCDPFNFYAPWRCSASKASPRISTIHRQPAQPHRQGLLGIQHVLYA